MYLMLLNLHLKTVKVVNFVLHKFLLQRKITVIQKKIHDKKKD